MPGSKGKTFIRKPRTSNTGKQFENHFLGKWRIQINSWFEWQMLKMLHKWEKSNIENWKSDKCVSASCYGRARVGFAWFEILSLLGGKNKQKKNNKSIEGKTPPLVIYKTTLSYISFIFFYFGRWVSCCCCRTPFHFIINNIIWWCCWKGG